MDIDTPLTNLRLLLRIHEAARMLGIGRSTAYELINAGEIPVVRIGRSVRISTTDLTVWVAAQPRDRAGL